MNPYSQSPYRTPPAVMNLLIVNAIVFLGTMLVGSRLPQGAPNPIFEHLALYPLDSPLFRPWQLLTHLFLHANMMHIFSNMFALWMFGRTLEERLGTKRFLTYYFVCGLGAAALQLLVYALTAAPYYASTLGASGAVFGLLLAFGMMFPDARILLLIPPIPLKAKWFVIFYGLFELYAGVSGSMDGVAHFAHLGGMIFGFFLILYWKRSRTAC